jgi:hypothetical protein
MSDLGIHSGGQILRVVAHAMPIQPGELWVADIPFASGSGSKKRPVVILWLDGLDAVAAP